jgi:lysophospholipase L1-like esterase
VTRPSDEPRRAVWRKRLLVATLSLVAAMLLLEGVARVGAWLYYGRNPYYLFYGFRSWTSDTGEGHSEKLDGYFKFPASQTIRHGLPEPGRINNLGFRGPDFAAAKPSGTFRIVCMGGSSTFGYTDADADTYPARLQGLFDAAPTRRRVEVINGGIPHFNTNHLVAMLESEALSWSPDALTLYCAYNDAIYPLAENRWQSATRKLDEYSAAFACLRKLVNAGFGDVLFHQWSAYLPQMDAAAVARQIELHRAMTRSNLERIAALAASAGARIVVVRQPMTLWFWRCDRGLVTGPRPALTYDGEVAEVRARLERSSAITGWESVLLVHRAVLEEVDAFAARHALPVVDNVALLDAHPDGFSSYVHLTADANARLAEALHAALVPLVDG